MRRAHVRWLEVTGGEGADGLFTVDFARTQDGHRNVVAVVGHAERHAFIEQMLIERAKELGVDLRREALPGRGVRFVCATCLGVAEGSDHRYIPCRCRSSFRRYFGRRRKRQESAGGA